LVWGLRYSLAAEASEKHENRNIIFSSVLFTGALGAFHNAKAEECILSKVIRRNQILQREVSRNSPEYFG